MASIWRHLVRLLPLTDQRPPTRTQKVVSTIAGTAALAGVGGAVWYANPEQIWCGSSLCYITPSSALLPMKVSTPAASTAGLDETSLGLSNILNLLQGVQDIYNISAEDLNYTVLVQGPGHIIHYWDSLSPNITMGTIQPYVKEIVDDPVPSSSVWVSTYTLILSCLLLILMTLIISTALLFFDLDDVWLLLQRVLGPSPTDQLAQQQLAVRNDELDAARAEIQRQQKANSSLQKQIRLAGIDTLQAQVGQREPQKDLKILRANHEALRLDYEALKIDHSTIKGQLKGQKDIEAKCQQTVNEADTARLEAVLQLSEALHNANQASAMVTTLEATVDELTSEVMRLNNADQGRAQLEEALRQAQSTKTEALSQLADLKQKFFKSEVDIVEKDSEIEELESEVAIVEDERNLRAAELSEEKLKNKRLEEDLADSRRSDDWNVAELQRKDVSIKRLEDELAGKHSDGGQSSAGLDEKEPSIERLENELATLRNEKKDTTEHSSEMLKALEQTKKDLEALKSENASLMQAHEATARRAKLVDQLEAEKNRLAKDLAKTRVERDAFVAELNRKEKESAEAEKVTAIKENFAEEKAILKTQVSDLMARIAGLERASEEVDVLRQKVTDMDAEILRLNTLISEGTQGSDNPDDSSEDKASHSPPIRSHSSGGPERPENPMSGAGKVDPSHMGPTGLQTSQLQKPGRKLTHDSPPDAAADRPLKKVPALEPHHVSYQAANPGSPSDPRATGPLGGPAPLASGLGIQPFPWIGQQGTPALSRGVFSPQQPPRGSHGSLGYFPHDRPPSSPWSGVSQTTRVSLGSDRGGRDVPGSAAAASFAHGRGDGPPAFQSPPFFVPGTSSGPPTPSVGYPTTFTPSKPQRPSNEEKYYQMAMGFVRRGQPVPNHLKRYVPSPLPQAGPSSLEGPTSPPSDSSVGGKKDRKEKKP